MKTTCGVDATAFLSLPVPSQMPQPFHMPAPDCSFGANVAAKGTLIWSTRFSGLAARARLLQG